MIFSPRDASLASCLPLLAAAEGLPMYGPVFICAACLPVPWCSGRRLCCAVLCCYFVVAVRLLRTIASGVVLAGSVALGVGSSTDF